MTIARSANYANICLVGDVAFGQDFGCATYREKVGKDCRDWRDMELEEAICTISSQAEHKQEEDHEYVRC